MPEIHQMHSTGACAPKASLLAIVGVEKVGAVQCQHPGCNHRVYRRIHVVNEAGHLLVLGSSCFAKRYGSRAVLGQPSIGGANGRQLSDDERPMLVDNTADLLARYRQEHLETQAAMKEKLRSLKAEFVSRPVGSVPPVPPSVHNVWHQSIRRPPWAWVKPLSSVAYFHLKDQTGWVRVQHVQGVQMLMPWPSFEGWDEVFPTSVGSPDLDTGGYEITDLIQTVSFLRARSEWDRVGNWSEAIP